MISKVFTSYRFTSYRNYGEEDTSETTEKLP